VNGIRPLLRIENLSKSFPGVTALENVCLELNRGEILALVGENGAGKSTLIKILTGVYQKDQGHIFIEDLEVNPRSPSGAFTLGIRVIHQEFNLVPEMSAAENVFLGRQPKLHGLLGKLGAIDKRQVLKRTQDLLNRLGGDFPAGTLVKRLGVGQQQLVEICKALAFNARIVVMDEPTSTLGSADVKNLIETIHRLKDQGIAVVFVTHRLEEVFQIADRIVVLRDGGNAGGGNTAELTMEQVINMMVGRVLDKLYPKEPAEIGDVVLKVSDLSRGNLLKHISFELRRGEILGFAGLVGAHRTDLMRAIFGVDQDVTGEIVIEGTSVHLRNPSDAVRFGLGLVPEDRKLQGLVLNLAIRENISLASLGRLLRLIFIDRSLEDKLTLGFINQIHIRARHQEQAVKYLSGGNQQKVVLAKWLALRPKVLILDEPTRGVDVGAKAEIHALIRQFAQQGMGVILVSSELPEILGMCDRILVMGRGAITGEFARDEANQENIMACAMMSVPSDRRTVSAMGA
jgi:ABC-type sugar transport system ATPase subunit